MKQFIREQFTAAGLMTDHGPIVAVNENSSNPHYEPTAEMNREIRPRDWLLIDMWAKADTADGVYYDITWTAYCGPEPPSKMQNIFEIVRAARDRAVAFVEQGIREGRTLHGFEVDDVAEATSASTDMRRVSSTEPGIRSARRCTAPAPTWTIWKPTMSDGSFPPLVSQSSPASTYRNSAFGPRWTFSSKPTARASPEKRSSTS